jgi:hypothetical protein
MCSSPKSSGSSTPKVRLKGFFEDMSTDKRKRFTEVANRADENRQRRNEINKRWAAKTASNPPPPSFFNWLNNL